MVLITPVAQVALSVTQAQAVRPVNDDARPGRTRPGSVGRDLARLRSVLGLALCRRESAQVECAFSVSSAEDGREGVEASTLAGAHRAQAAESCVKRVADDDERGDGRLAGHAVGNGGVDAGLDRGRDGHVAESDIGDG